MRPAKVSEQDLIEKLLGVFRVHGYDGASLSLLSEATGLKRASLYHRFPGGKDEMLQAVADHVDGWFGTRIFEPLAGPGTPPERVRAVVDSLAGFYCDGRLPCVLDTLSLGGDESPAKARIRASWEAFQQALAGPAKEAGCGEKEANRRAEDALIGLQGALILARVTGNPAPFRRVLDGWPALLTSTPAE